MQKRIINIIGLTSIIILLLTASGCGGGSSDLIGTYSNKPNGNPALVVKYKDGSYYISIKDGRNWKTFMKMKENSLEELSKKEAFFDKYVVKAYKIGNEQAFFAKIRSNAEIEGKKLDTNYILLLGFFPVPLYKISNETEIPAEDLQAKKNLQKQIELNQKQLTEQQAKEADIRRAEAKFNYINNALNRYYKDNYYFPLQLQDLTAKPKFAENWNGPYISNNAQVKYNDKNWKEKIENFDAVTFINKLKYNTIIKDRKQEFTLSYSDEADTINKTNSESKYLSIYIWNKLIDSKNRVILSAQASCPLKLKIFLSNRVGNDDFNAYIKFNFFSAKYDYFSNGNYKWQIIFDDRKFSKEEFQKIIYGFYLLGLFIHKDGKDFMTSKGEQLFGLNKIKSPGPDYKRDWMSTLAFTYKIENIYDVYIKGKYFKCKVNLKGYPSPFIQEILSNSSIDSLIQPTYKRDSIQTKGGVRRGLFQRNYNQNMQSLSKYYCTEQIIELTVYMDFDPNMLYGTPFTKQVLLSPKDGKTVYPGKI